MLKLMAVKTERVGKGETVLHFAKYRGRRYFVKSEEAGAGRIVEVLGAEIRFRNLSDLLDSELADGKRGEKAVIIRRLRRPPSLIYSKDSKLPKPSAMENAMWSMVFNAPSDKGLGITLLFAPSNYHYSVLVEPEKKISGRIIRCRMAAPPALVLMEESRLHISMIL